MIHSVKIIGEYKTPISYLIFKFNKVAIVEYLSNFFFEKDIGKTIVYGYTFNHITYKRYLDVPDGEDEDIIIADENSFLLFISICKEYLKYRDPKCIIIQDSLESFYEEGKLTLLINNKYKLQINRIEAQQIVTLYETLSNKLILM